MPHPSRFMNRKKPRGSESLSPIRTKGWSSPSPKRRKSPSRRKSRSPLRKKSRSPNRKRSRSPVRRKSRSPIRRKSRSPIRRKSRSPIRRKSRSPVRRKSRSPDRRFSRSPQRHFSKSPRRRFSKSPLRKNSRSPNRRFSRSPVRNSPRRNSPSPRRRLTHSPIRKYSPPHRRQLSRSPDRKSSPPSRKRISRSPIRKLSPGRRLTSSPGRDRNNGRDDRKRRSRSLSRTREDRHDQKDRYARSPERTSDRFDRLDNTRFFKRSPSFSPPRRSPEYSSRSIVDRLGPISPNAGPKIIRDTSGLSKIEPLIIRKKTLNERYRTVDDGHFRIDENITIGIQRNPYAPASTSVTVQKVFDPHLFSMVHSRDSGKLPIFDRPELKYFRFDDLPHNDEEQEFERRTINLAPSTSRSDSSRYGSLHLSRRSPSPKRPTEVRLEMRPDPKYEKIYQESHDSRYSKVVNNPNDLRHNIAKRSYEEDARYKIDARRKESDHDDRGERVRRSRERNRSRSRSRSPGFREHGGRNDKDNNKQDRRRGNSRSPKKDEDVPDFSRRPDRTKYKPWVDNPSQIPKGVSYFQSTGKAKIVRYIEGYIVGVTAKFKSHRNVDQFYFRLYHENMFVHGISFNYQFWSTLKTLDGSTCLGVVFQRAKLRPPRDHKPCNLVIDRFTIVKTKLMPFPMHLETEERPLVKSDSKKTVDLYADEEAYDFDEPGDDDDDDVADKSYESISEDDLALDRKSPRGQKSPAQTNIQIKKEQKEVKQEKRESEESFQKMPKEINIVFKDNKKDYCVAKGSNSLKQEPENKTSFKVDKFLIRNRSYRKREASPSTQNFKKVAKKRY